MPERMDNLPPQLRSFIARAIQTHSSQGLVSTSDIMGNIDQQSMSQIPRREIEDAIAEEAVAAGLAVHFNAP